MATCFGIVEQNGGRIEFDSELDRDTTFRIRLPRVLVDDSPAPVTDDPVDLHRGTGTVLIVEDEPLVSFIQKPFMPADLVVGVQEVLGV